jgi:hypothetical protein
VGAAWKRDCGNFVFFFHVVIREQLAVNNCQIVVIFWGDLVSERVTSTPEIVIYAASHTLISSDGISRL